MTVKKKIIFLSLSLITLLLITGAIQLRSVISIGNQWKAFQNTALERQVQLSEMTSQFGYGGFIHNFKNHVLRGTQKYADRFRENKNRMDKAFSAYEQFSLTSDERTALAAIKYVAGQYSRAISTSVSMNDSGDDVVAIDKIVKINDTPAINGFQVLSKHVKALEGSAEKSLNDTIRGLLILMVIAGSAMATFFILFFLVLGSVARRLARLHETTVEMGKGNFSVSIEDKGSDEIATIATALGEMGAKLHCLTQQVYQQAESLTSSSDALNQISSELSEGTRDASHQADSVAAASEEMSSNMNSVAAASEQASTNVNLVSTAIEEILSSVDEEAKQSAKAQEITRHAVELAASSSQKVDALGSAAAEISKVTEVITEISAQTNLLALNATIEAARAGEAGKGFAVVANEIKELAKQTSEATLEIKNNISSIQGSTNETVDEIRQISSVIAEVDSIVTEISIAVQEQNATSDEISQNVVQAAQGIAEVNENVAQSSAVSSEISHNIAETSAVVSRLASSGDIIKDTATQLREQVAILKQLISQFQ